MIARACQGWGLVIWTACCMLLASCGSDATQPVKRDALYPKVVLQTLPLNGVELAVWTPDDKHIITAVGQTRTVLIWEVATGHIVDRLLLPSKTSASGGVRRLRAMAVSADGRSLTIDAETAAIAEAQYDDPRIERFVVDLMTKEVSMAQAPADLKPKWAGAEIEDARVALGRLYEGNESISLEKADDILLPLPASHDGKWQLKRLATPWEVMEDGSSTEGGLELVPTDGIGSPRRLTQPPKVRFADADLSPDGRYFLILDGIPETDEAGNMVTRYQIFDLEAAQFLFEPDELPGRYNKIQWLDDQYLLAGTFTYGRDRFETYGNSSLPDALVIEQEIGAFERIPGRCYLAPAPGYVFYGAPVANCRQSAETGRSGIALQRFDSERKTWEAFSDLRLQPGEVVDSLAVSPDGSRVFAAILDAADGETGDITLTLIDTASGRTIRRQKVETRAYLEKPVFAADGMQVLFSLGETMHAWAVSDGALDKLPITTVDTTMIATSGQLLAVGGESDDAISLYDMQARKIAARLDYGNILTGGFVPDKPLYWALSNEEGIRIWDTRDWSELLTTYVFYNQGFMTVTPEGRYDTNIHPYKAQFRWLVPDEPFQSLNPDTFSRDYYTPGVGHRRITCAVEGNCAEVFAPLRSIADLNRTLPTVRIRSVAQLPGDPRKAEVILEIEEGVNPAAANGKTRSGIFNPRLLRNHQLAVDEASTAAVRRLKIDEWRNEHRLEARNGRAELRRIVTLPTGDTLQSEGIVITAYAFNEDRLKSETAQFAFKPKRYPAPRAPRAYVVAIGIDHYREQRLDLSYAGADAALMRDRLKNIPGYYKTRHLTIATTGTAAPLSANGQVRYVTRDTILPILAILAGRNRDEMLGKLRRQGIDASMLEAATPDDLVILSYSGHGWADKSGEFFIVPSEASWAKGATTPKPTSLLSSLELAAALQAIDAGEMALIIDACHAAASVEDGSFKPGPLGDPGLGQLAFDKGVRILSATQADDVAREEGGKRRQGLLTYVLLKEGLGSEYPFADSGADNELDLREWLDYPVWRLPQLIEQGSGNVEATDTRARALVFHDGKPARAKPRIQKPSLFDFNVGPPRTVVQTEVPQGGGL